MIATLHFLIGSKFVDFSRYVVTNPIGSITQSSATTVAYNTTSDRRIKENIVNSASGLERLAKITVRGYIASG